MTNQSRTPGSFEAYGEEVPISPVDVYFSNLNLPTWEITRSGFRRLNHTLDALRDSEEPLFVRDGIEVTPTRRLLVDGHFSWLRAGAVRQPQPLTVGDILHGGLPKARLMHELGMAATMPAVSERTLDMLGVKGIELGEVPTIVNAAQRNPYDSRLFNFNHYNLTKCEAPLTPELVLTVAPSAIFEQVHKSLNDRGVNGLVIDTHAIARGAHYNDGYHIPRYKMFEAIERTGTPITRIRVAVGQVATAHDHDRHRSMQEFDALLAGEGWFRRTYAGETLEIAYDIWKRQQLRAGVPAEQSRLPVTIDVPYDALANGRSNRLKLRNAQRDLALIHRQIASTLHTFFVEMD